MMRCAILRTMTDNLPEMISRTEATARSAGVSVDNLCKSAGISRATWQRWKAGTVSPTFRKWQQVETAVRAAADAAPAAEPEDFSGEAAA